MIDPSRASGGSRLAPAAAAASFAIWGVMPLLFQALARGGASAWEILAHRGVWAVPFAALFVTAAGQWRHAAETLRQPRSLALLALSAAVIGANWILFIWAVNNGRTLDASLGYYINPLLNMVIGAALFRERMDGFGRLAIALALIGVVIQTFALGRPPVVSLLLATTFAAYGLIRRQVKVEAQTGLLLESVLIGALAIFYVVWLEHSGGGHFLARPAIATLLVFSGLATATPLMLFAWAARRITFSLLGFLQFIAPTLQFVVGYLNGEAFTPLRALSFLFIWAGAACFVWGAWRKRMRLQPA